jgi:hypothetical protein
MSRILVILAVLVAAVGLYLYVQSTLRPSTFLSVPTASISRSSKRRCR